MATNTTLPTRPNKNSPVGQQIWTVWSMLLYFINSVFDAFAGKFATGTTQVAQGGTSVVVTHGLNKAVYVALVTPVNDPGGYWGTSGPWWVTNKTSTQFTLNIPGAAPVGGILFDWMVKAP